MDCAYTFFWYILTGLKGRKRYYYWTHLLLLVMLIGGITSAGMGGKFMVEAGKSVSKGILSKILEDYVVEETKESYEKGSIIIYNTKPLINLFWIGSFGVLGSMLVESGTPKNKEAK